MSKLLLVAASIFLIQSVSRAEEPLADPIPAKIKAAEDAFYAERDKADQALIKLLERKEAAAKQAGDLKTLEVIRIETEAFRKEGKLPKSFPLTAFDLAMKTAWTKLESHQLNAIKSYTQANKIEEAKAIQTKLEEFKKKFVNEQAPTLGKELLENPGGEAPLLPDGGIPGWKPVKGGWGLRNTHPVEGSKIIYPAAPFVAVQELAQDVSLDSFVNLVANGSLEASFKVSVRSGKQSPADLSQVILEFRDTANKNVLDSWDSGKIKSTDGWRELSEKRTIHKETAWVRVRLISSRSAGSANDAYYDNLSLVVTLKK